MVIIEPLKLNRRARRRGNESNTIGHGRWIAHERDTVANPTLTRRKGSPPNMHVSERMQAHDACRPVQHEEASSTHATDDRKREPAVPRRESPATAADARERTRTHVRHCRMPTRTMTVLNGRIHA